MHGYPEHTNPEEADSSGWQLESKLNRCSRKICAPQSLYSRIDYTIGHSLACRRKSQGRIRLLAYCVLGLASVLAGIVITDEPTGKDQQAENNRKDPIDEGRKEITLPVGVPTGRFY